MFLHIVGDQSRGGISSAIFRLNTNFSVPYSNLPTGNIYADRHVRVAKRTRLVAACSIKRIQAELKKPVQQFFRHAAFSKGVIRIQPTDIKGVRFSSAYVSIWSQIFKVHLRSLSR